MAVGLPLSYYDRILAAIAASLAGGVFVGLATPGSVRVGIFVGGLLATVFVYLGVFRNPPLPETSPRVKTAALLWHVLLAILFAVTVY